MTDKPIHPNRVVRRASPFAVVGAFGLVALSIFFGLLGPQINNRGNVILGPSLDELLTGSLGYYQRERNELRMVALTPAVDPDSIRKELLRRFDDRAKYLDLSGCGYAPVHLDTLESLVPGEEDVVMVLYGADEQRSGEEQVTDLIYFDESHRRIAEDRFGVPMVMEPGAIYRSKVGGSEPGRDAWTASWYEGSVLHVLLAESVDRLEALLGSINQANPGDSDWSELSGPIAHSGLDPSLLQARLT